MREEQDLAVDIVHEWFSYTRLFLYNIIECLFLASLYERSYKATNEFLSESQRMSHMICQDVHMHDVI